MVHVLGVTAQRRQRSGTGTLKPHVATSGLKGATAASSTVVFYNPYFVKSQSGAGRRVIPYSLRGARRTLCRGFNGWRKVLFAVLRIPLPQAAARLAFSKD